VPNPRITSFSDDSFLSVLSPGACKGLEFYKVNEKSESWDTVLYSVSAPQSILIYCVHNQQFEIQTSNFIHQDYHVRRVYSSEPSLNEP